MGLAWGATNRQLGASYDCCATNLEAGVNAHNVLDCCLCNPECCWGWGCWVDLEVRYGPQPHNPIMLLLVLVASAQEDVYCSKGMRL